MIGAKNLKLNASAGRTGAPPWPTALALTGLVGALHLWLLLAAPIGMRMDSAWDAQEAPALSTRVIEPAAGAGAAQAGPATAATRPTPSPALAAPEPTLAPAAQPTSLPTLTAALTPSPATPELAGQAAAAAQAAEIVMVPAPPEPAPPAPAPAPAPALAPA